MLVNHFTTTVLAACALLAAPVFANPAAAPAVELDSDFEISAVGDIEVKFWDSTNCKTSRSKKTFFSGHCINSLNSKDHAVSMQARKNSKCHLIRYEKNNCKGHAEKDLNLDDCFNIGDRWKSLKFQC